MLCYYQGSILHTCNDVKTGQRREHNKLSYFAQYTLNCGQTLNYIIYADNTD